MKFLKKHWEELILFFIILLGLFLRLIPALRIEFWYDEAFTALAREEPFFSIIFSEPPHPPFFYWVVKIWSQINTSEIFLRVLPIGFSLLSIFLVFKICCLVRMNKLFPLTSAFLFSISFYQIDNSYQLRMYSLVLMWMLISSLSFLMMLKTNEKRWLWFFPLSNFLGLITDYAFIWYFGCLVCVLLLCLVFSLRINFKFDDVFRKVKRGMLISFFLMVLWLPIFLRNFRRAYAMLCWSGEPNFSNYLNKMFYIFSFNPNIANREFWLPFFLIVLVFTVLSGSYFLWKTRVVLNSFIFWLAIFVITVVPFNLAFLASKFIVKPILHEKNQIVVSLVPVFVIGGVVSWLITRKQLLVKLFGIIFLFINIYTTADFFLNGEYSGFLKTRWNKSSNKDAVEFVRKNVNLRKDLLVFIAPWEQTTFDYFFYQYNKGNPDRSLSYRNWEGGFLEKNRNYWIINRELSFIYDVHADRSRYEPFSQCIEREEPIFYKKAIIYKCER